jgi:hypothetical protein
MRVTHRVTQRGIVLRLRPLQVVWDVTLPLLMPWAVVVGAIESGAGEIAVVAIGV